MSAPATASAVETGAIATRVATRWEDYERQLANAAAAAHARRVDAALSAYAADLGAARYMFTADLRRAAGPVTRQGARTIHAARVDAAHRRLEQALDLAPEGPTP